MVQYRRSRIANAPYFLTVTLRDRRASTLVEHVDDLRRAFAETRTARPFTTEAIVVLPDHFHWICTLPEGDADYSTRVMLIKRNFTRRLAERGLAMQRDSRGEYTLWQRRFWEHTIRDENDMQRHVDYIHFNPVKHGVAQSVSDWPHSSFHRYVRDGILSADWGGGAVTASTSQFGE